MAKKKAAAKFGMAEELRVLLTENPNLTSREAMEKIRAKFPDRDINEKSFGVAFYSARKKVGAGGNGKPSKKIVRRKVPTATRPTVDLSTLQAAVTFLGAAGSSEVAIEAIKQVQALQLN
jgi:hypothetical protein